MTRGFAVRWLLLPLLAGVLAGSLVDPLGLPFLGRALAAQPRLGAPASGLTAVALLDGQAYFGRLEDLPWSDELVLHDVYYFQDAKGAGTNTSVGIVRRGSELHAPLDGMRIKRDKILAVESIAAASEVAQAIVADRAIRGLR